MSMLWLEKLLQGISGFAGKTRQRMAKWSESVSSPRFLMPKSVIYFTAMFLFSFLVIALETIQFHMLLAVTNYLKATFMISIAMLGIAMGSLLGFYLSKLKVQGILFHLGSAPFLLHHSLLLQHYQHRGPELAVVSHFAVYFLIHNRLHHFHARQFKHGLLRQSHRLRPGRALSRDLSPDFKERDIPDAPDDHPGSVCVPAGIPDPQ